MPVELGFILQQLAAMAGQDTSLRERQLWKAADEFTAHLARSSLSLPINHDDNEREIAYCVGAVKSIDAAKQRGWVVVSIKDDW